MVRRVLARHLRRRVHVLPPREGRFRERAIARRDRPSRRALLAVAAFALVTLVVATGLLQSIDVRLLSTIQVVHAGWLDLVSSLLTVAGSAPVTAGLAAGVAVARLRSRRRDFWVPLAIAIAVVVEAVLKLTLPQPLPPEDLHRGVELLSYAQPSLPFAYPSGHVARATFLLLSTRIPAGLATAGILVMAVSRVYLGQHWPSDAVGGLLLGMALAWTVRSIARG